MVAAGHLVELLFGAASLIPDGPVTNVLDRGISWNYTTWLNIVFLLLAGVLLVRFVRGGGVPMLRHTGGDPAPAHPHH